MGLRTKLASGFLLPLAVTVVAASLLEVEHATQTMVDQLASSGNLLVRQVFEQMRSASPSGLRELGQVRAFRDFLDSTLAFGEGVVSVRIDGPDGVTLVAAPEALERYRLPVAASIEQLQSKVHSFDPLAGLLLLWRDHVYEVSRPVKINKRFVGTIRIDLSTGLISAKVHNLIVNTLYIIAVALGLGSAVWSLMVGTVLRSVTAITTGVEQLTTTRSTVNVRVGTGDEIGRLAAKFNRLSRRIMSDRDEWERERNRLFRVIGSINDAVIRLDSDGRVLFANVEALGRLGLPAGMMEGKTLSCLLGPDHPLLRLIGPALAARAEIENVALELSEGPEPCRFLVSLLSLGSKPEDPGSLLIMRDVAAVNELEEVLDRSRTLAKQVGMVSGIGHQIRNPLHAMSLQLALLAEDTGRGVPIAERIKCLRHEIDRINQAVAALLRFIRLERLNLSSFSLNDLLRDVAARHQGHSATVACDLDPNIGDVEADGALLAEALENLVTNGIQAMKDGGTLRLSTRFAGDGTVEILVSDDGPGIPPEHVDRIFEFYFSTKDGGCGIGLPMALRIIDMHHGALEVDSNPGRGTTARIRLPSSQNGEPSSTVQPLEA